MEWVDGIPTIFGKGNWCNRLKLLLNQAVQNVRKTVYRLFPHIFLDETRAICFTQLTKLTIVIKPSNPSNYTLIPSYSNREPSIFQAVLCTKKYQYYFYVF